jgi:acetylornithine/N-succinyldiaminopimelate aminotransferase
MPKRVLMKNIIWSTGHQLKFGNITGSDNCFLYDEDGNRLVDLESGVWCTSVGHNNQRINQVITNQIGRITHTGFCYGHPAIDETALKVLEITGLNGGKCEFLCSGSEAVEFGMRIARTISEKSLALTFTDSYFGAYGDAASKNKNGWYIYDRLNCGCATSPEGCTGECEEFKKIPFSQIGIFMFEPGSSMGLVRFPSEKLIRKITDRIKPDGGIIMANEVTTGIGRTGKWFGYEHYNLQPDIVAMGKGIGNGYPVSITAISKSISKKLDPKGFIYAQSHQNDPLGAVVAGEVIQIIEDKNLLDACNQKGNFLNEQLEELRKKCPVIKEIRGRGLMLAIEFHKDAMLIYEKLLEEGFIVCKRPNAEVLRLDPALTIEMETLEMFMDVLEKILK